MSSPSPAVPFVPGPSASSPRAAPGAIWAHAVGYFASYVPYAFLAKAVSAGLLPGMGRGIGGLALLPGIAAASLATMAGFLVATGWWRSARRLRVAGLDLPWPGPWTALSGLATAAIIATTTLAYTLEGVSIVFMMLLMRGGVLALAPLVDAVSGRTIRRRAWWGLGLSLGALVVSFVAQGPGDGPWLRVVAALDVGAYLGGYLVRLHLMSRLAKADDVGTMRRYFVEEQLVSTPAVFVALVAAAVVGVDPVRRGFLEVPTSPAFWAVLLAGAGSQFVGIFGGLVLLDGRENAFCVPVNRCSSILAGVLASVALWVVLDNAPPRPGDVVGAGMVVLALVVLGRR